MADNITKRSMSPAEDKVIKMLRVFEHLASNNKLTVKIKMQLAPMLLLGRENIAKVLKLEFDSKDDKYFVTFTLREFKKYVDYCCGRVYFTVNIDGSILTFDNILITHEEIEKWK